MADELNVSCEKLTELPDNLPPNLKKLWCEDNQLTTLPDNLPQSLKALYCDNNQITALPNILPPSLQYLYCSENQITALPANLPQSLQKLDCSFNQLTTLPDILPQSLQRLWCNNNQLTYLPDILPSRLIYLNSSNNNLTILPDLPTSIKSIGLENNPLETNYPLIYTFKNTQESIAYVNGRNREMRRERMLKINPDNKILEHYMRRMMHPSRLTALKENPDLDVEEYMARYVESL